LGLRMIVVSVHTMPAAMVKKRSKI